MPRLDDGELGISASKFKKRRAWITPDPIIETILSISQHTDGETTENPSTEAIEEHDYNKSASRAVREYNKSRSTLERKTSLIEASIHDLKTRDEHDHNQDLTRVDRECNKNKTDFDTEKLFAFIDVQKASIVKYEDDPRCSILILSDAQKRIFWRIAIECLNRDALQTGPIEIKGFFGKLAISTPVVRTTLNRLADKRLIKREKGKLGKNGFAIISLPKMMFDSAYVIFNDFKAQL